MMFYQNDQYLESFLRRANLMFNGESPHPKYGTPPLMQFTGLLDRHGIRVFEGDILRDPPKNDWENHNYTCYEVFFHNGDANTDYNIGWSMNRTHHKGALCGGHIPSFKPRRVITMEIIGNIYQKPEGL